MSDLPSGVSEAIVICTRNRPEELNHTLHSVAEQSEACRRFALVVDGSDTDEAERTARVVEAHRQNGRAFFYHRYPGSPAGTRQRNAGIDLLPPDVNIVHFIDDDIAVEPGYFEDLSDILRRNPSLLGVGGIIKETNVSSPRPPIRWWHRLFLLRTNQPGRVLPSGQTTSAWPSDPSSVQPADWLATGASSYRMTVFDEHRFDPTVEGASPRLEDLDFSFRVATQGSLGIVPTAQCIHRVSSSERRSTFYSVQQRIVRRYWFVTKNLGHRLNHLAFWWSVFGRFLAFLFSSHPDRVDALRGLFHGVKIILTNSHPLLKRPADQSGPA